MSNGGTSNRGILLWASFLTLIAAGMGFAIRGDILGDWETAYGFTKTQLGGITGGGLTGFGLIIIASSFFVDKVGYKPLLLIAFVLHILSAGLLYAADPIYAAYGNPGVFWLLYVSTFMFAIGNGLCEAVINPLVATLYPKDKTHYLNLLHAGWPGGLILGAIINYLFVGTDATVAHLNWKLPMLVFLVPVIAYGVMIIRAKFPQSEVAAAGISFGQMMKEFAAPLLIFLFIIHAMVGYVELGTDSWIQDIMRAVISGYAVLLFIYTSAIMFVLRFFAGPIVEKINPIGLLLISAILATVGLGWLGLAQTGFAILAAATIYGVGKTFFWPTMLGVVGERFPRGGAITMGVMGGIGMLSAGMLGGPGIGYKQDVNATAKIKELEPTDYQQYLETAPFSTAKNEFVNPGEQNEDGTWPADFGEVVQKPKPVDFLFFPETNSLNGKLVGDARVAKAEKGEEAMTETEEHLYQASIYGGQRALLWTAAVPATMAVCYLLLLIYFKSIGGYKQEHIGDEYYTGGVEGPADK